MIKHRGFSRACALAMALLTGCSLINPYVREPNLDHVYDQNDGFAGDLPKAIQDADGQRRAYYRAVGNQSTLRNGAALAIIPMSAAALYLGIAGAGQTSRDAIAALGLGSASLFGLTSYLYSEPRQRVYIFGSQTIGCAIMSMRAFLMPRADYDAFTQDLADLDPLVAEAIGELQRVQFRHDALARIDAGNAVVRAVEPDITVAASQIAAGNSALDAGYALHADVDQGGFVLRTKVQSIVDSVSLEIEKTEPDLQALMGILAGLRESATKLAPAPSAKPAAAAPGGFQKGVRTAETPATLAEELRWEVERLRQHTEEIAVLASRVMRRVNRATAIRKQTGDIETCKVPEVDGGFKVIPDQDPIEVAAGSKFSFVVIGGTGTPRVAVVGPQGSSLKATTNTDSGNFVVTVAADSSASGDAQIVFTDSTGKSQKTINVKIGAGGGTPKKPGGDGGDGKKVEPADPCPGKQGPQNPTELALSTSPETIKALQKKVNVAKPTGTFDPDTRRAILSWQQSTGQLRQDCILDDEQLKQLGIAKPPPSPTTPSTVPPSTPPSTAPPPSTAVPPTTTAPAPHAFPCAALPSAAQNDVEAKLSDGDRQDIQKMLGVSQSGTLDPATRDAIGKWQSQRHQPVTCVLDVPLIKNILGIP